MLDVMYRARGVSVYMLEWVEGALDYDMSIAEYSMEL